ncbi:MAG: glycosyltransferase family 1 protein, partial [Terrimicrobiaceae bacterium]
VLAGDVVWENFSPAETARLREILAQPPPNLLFLPGRIPDEAAFNSLVHDAGILFLAYEDFPNSSNMLTKAAVFERPVITSQGFCMGRRTEHFRLGLTVPEANPAACAAAIRQIAAGHIPNPDWDGYRRRHDRAALHAAFTKLLAASG